MKRTMLLLFLAGILFAGLTGSNNASAAESDSKSGAKSTAKNVAKSTADHTLSAGEFARIPGEARPWVYYWWLKGNIDEEQITRDLEAMKQQGFGGLLLFDSRRYHDDYDSVTHLPVPLHIKHEFMSPSWRKLIVHTVREADRLGLKVSMNISDSGGVLRGPWERADAGPKELVWTEENVNGPKNVSIPFRAPGDKPYYRDVAVMAVRITSAVSPGREVVKLGATWQNAVAPGKQSATATDVIDLSANVKNDTLRWDVPKGHWKILRFGRYVVGDFGSVDILNRKAVSDYYRQMCGQIVKDVGPLAGKTLTHFYNVSWEGSNPDWTDGFEESFAKYRKYELRPNMPVLCGLVIGDLEKSLRLTRDFYRTVSDCFRENCYANIGEMCHKDGIVWHSEDGGPWRRNAPIFRDADMLSFWGQNDIAQGEFWVNEKNFSTRSNMRACSMAAHIYGQKRVACESFTHMRYHWTMYPARLKPAADTNFIDGMNMLIWHTFTSSPKELGQPGFEYFAGTHINTNVTWWDKVRGFVDYLARCQYMLRKGAPVVDVCAYVSDMNYVGWGRMEKWNDKSKLVLPKGYAYDLLDTNVLVNRMKFGNGGLVLPDGMSYRILVVDPIEKTLPAESLEKIVELAKQGCSVVLGETIPEATPGLTDAAGADKRVAAAVKALWGDGPRKGAVKLGKGTVYRGMTMEEVFAHEKLVPDCAGPFEFNHRKNGADDLYFVTGQGRAECVFRNVGGKVPRLWDPMTGNVKPALARRSLADNRIAVTLELPECGSTFVVFESGKASRTECVAFEGPQGLVDTALDGGVKYTFWNNGTWTVTTEREKKTLEIKTPEPVELTGAWGAVFEPNRGGPHRVVFDKLTLWNESANKEMKYFSGTAVYRKTFAVTADQANRTARIAFGAIHDIARVRLNGVDLGIVWIAPWTVDVTGKLKAGENKLEIEVTNCWANRLIGDSALPLEKRVTKTNLHSYDTLPKDYRPWNGFHPGVPLMPSGLVGPVRIEFAQSVSF